MQLRHYYSLLSFILLAACAHDATRATPSLPSGSPAPSAVMASAFPASTNSQLALAPTRSPTYNYRFAPLDSAVATFWAPIIAELQVRGVSCPTSFRLEAPETILPMSTDNWTVYTCSPLSADAPTLSASHPADYSDRFTKVRRVDASHEWTIVHDAFEWSQRPNAMLDTYRWTQNGQYLYLRPHTLGGGRTPGGIFVDGNALYRLDLNNGAFETVLAPLQSDYAYELSPTDLVLAYAIPDEHNLIHLTDMQTHNDVLVQLGPEYTLTGAFAWRPDGKRLYFAAATDGWQEGKARTSVSSLTLGNLHLQPIRINDLRQFVPRPCWDGSQYFDWTGSSLLCVASNNYGSDDYFTHWALDVRSGQVVALSGRTPGAPSTATPIRKTH